MKFLFAFLSVNRVEGICRDRFSTMMHARPWWLVVAVTQYLTFVSRHVTHGVHVPDENRSKDFSPRLIDRSFSLFHGLTNLGVYPPKKARGSFHESSHVLFPVVSRASPISKIRPIVKRTARRLFLAFTPLVNRFLSLRIIEPPPHLSPSSPTRNFSPHLRY